MRLSAIPNVLLILLCVSTIINAHGYIFSKANEEMKDNVRIEIFQDFMLIRFQSVYLGQIAPHIRLMIDSNEDELLTKSEIDLFFENYKKLINNRLSNRRLFLDEQSLQLNCVTAIAPNLLSDSLLAPFAIEMVFSIQNFNLETGENELIVDPKVLFETGNQFLRMARDSIEFTEEQEEAIGRFLQLIVVGDQNISFISTYPGRIRQKDKMAQIYGVFYEKTPLMDTGKDYPFIRIKFKVS